MRFGSEDLKGALTGPFNHYFVADLYYNGSLRIADIPITLPSLSEDADAKIQQSGTVKVVWADEFATSIVPKEIYDPLAPFGAQLFIYSVIWVGPFIERVAYGRFEITDVPSARDEEMQFQGRWIVTGSVVDLEVKELTDGIGHETFDVPSAPRQLVSTWAEVGDLSGLPLSRTVADAPINRSVMYPDSKLDAIYELMDVMLDAVPHITAYGAVSARPNAWPEPVDRLTMAGCLISVGHAMSAAKVYNRVVVLAPGGDESVLAVAEITEGRLRVRNHDGSASPFRARTYSMSSEFVTTAELAKPWAESTLAQVSTIRTRVVPVVETFNPLRERGDVVLIERTQVWLLGRVVTISRSERAHQSLTVEISGWTPKTEAPGPFDGWDDGWPRPSDYFPIDDLFPLDDLFPEAED